jgi:hypothetical protein
MLYDCLGSVLPVFGPAKLAFLHQILQQRVAYLRANAEEAGRLLGIQAQPRHFAIHADDERHEVRPLWLI